MIGILQTIFLILTAILLFPQNGTYVRANLDLLRSRITEENVSSYRLPDVIYPQEYRVKLRPILEEGDPVGSQWSVPGEVQIACVAKKESNAVALHAGRNVDISSIGVTRNGEEELISEWSYDEVTELVCFIVLSVIEVGENFTIRIEFISQIDTSGEFLGLYKSKVDYLGDGEFNGFLVATQLEPFQARNVFPIFDEPSFKAVFQLTIARKLEYSVFTNTQIFSSVPDEDPSWVWDEFETTPKMSPYLLGILISKLEKVEASSTPGSNISVNVIGTSWEIREGHANVLLENIPKNLEFYGEFFGKKYFLSKYDSAGIDDFVAGGMENWGMTLYKKSTVFVDPVELGEAERFNMLIVVAHETAHQWYGNLVTQVWWTDAWIKEGFATYASYKCVESTNPEFDTGNQAIVDGIQFAMSLEQQLGKDNYPLLLPDFPVPWDTYSLTFNTLMVYRKGAAIIRMMEGILTEPTIRRAMTRVLNEFEFSSVSQEELLNVFNAQGHDDGVLEETRDLKETMRMWTVYEGYPIVRVKIESATSVSIQQEPFLNSSSPGNDLWEIPVSFVSQSSPELNSTVPALWLSDGEVFVITHDTSEWILLNPDAYGYYRVLYDAQLSALIQEGLELDHKIFTAASRSQLFDDSFTFYFKAYTNVTELMGITSYLEKEEDYVVWKVVLRHLQRLNELVVEEDKLIFKDFWRPKLRKALETVGIVPGEDEKGVRVMLRSLLFEWACPMGLVECEVYSTDLFLQWKGSNSSRNPIPVDLQTAVYCTGVRVDRSNFEFLLDKYSSSSFRQKAKIAVSLGCTEEKDLIQEILLSSLPSSLNSRINLTAAESLKAIETVGGRKEGRNEIRLFLETQLDEILIDYPNGSFVEVVFQVLGRFVSARDEIIQDKEFTERNKDKLNMIVDKLNIQIKTMENNVEWSETFTKPIIRWIGENE